MHLDFAEILLEDVNTHNNSQTWCSAFKDHGWCDCHTKFNITVALNEGKGIFYLDVNENQNLAGTTINYANRALGFADRNQVLVARDAYEAFKEAPRTKDFMKGFRYYPNIPVKHDISMDIYQYRPRAIKVINRNVPQKLKYSMVSTGRNPWLNVTEVTATYETINDIKYKYSREVSLKPLRPIETSYRHIFTWSGAGRIKANIDKIKYPGYKIQLADDRSPAGGICTVIFDEPKKEGELLSFDFTLNLTAKTRKPKPCLSATIYDRVEKTLTLIVKLPISNLNRKYRLREFRSVIADESVMSIDDVLKTGETDITWSIEKPHLYHHYRIDWD